MTRIEKLEQVIFETSFIPFGISAYNRNQQVQDFVGRKEELHLFREHIQTILKSKLSLAVRLEGPAGVGKSTLFNFLKESIIKERLDEKQPANFLNENLEILSTYFSLMDPIRDFHDIWHPMIEGFRGEFAQETDHEMSLPEYVAYKFIYRVFQMDPDKVSELIWKETPRQKELKYISFDDIIFPIYNHPDRFVRDFQVYFQENKRIIRSETKAEINGFTYEIVRDDTEKILNLLRVLDEDDEYYDEINKGGEALFPNNSSLINFFNDLTRFYSVATGKQLLLLIGIDEIAKYTGSSKEDTIHYFTNLADQLIFLRNGLQNTLFTFISTSDDWANFDDVVKKLSGQSGQLTPLLKVMTLKPLQIEETIQIFKNRMRRFWNHYQMEKDPNYQYFPFSEYFFEYVYRFKHRDLRDTIVFLNEMWSSFRYHRKIPKLESKFDVLQFVRSFDQKPLTGDNLHKFEWDIIDQYFETAKIVKSNSGRSNAIERGLELAWSCYREKPLSQISYVKNNPTIKTSKGKRRPDVLVEIAGDLGKDYRRRVEFQVKAYGDSKVKGKEIESSIELFKENYTDMLFFIITGSGMDMNAEFDVEQLLKTYPNRIRKPILRRDQELALKFLALYNDIMGHEMGTNLDEDLPIAENCLRIILGQAPESFVNSVKLLSSRSFVEGDIEDEDYTVGIDDYFVGDENVDGGSPEEVGNIDTPLEIEKEQPIKSYPANQIHDSWGSVYPEQAKYKYEAAALALYLDSRMGGRYENQFTIPTVTKNVIRKDALLDEGNFKDLVKVMDSGNLLSKSGSSYVLTDDGKTWYESLKERKFQP